jgi:hypothetical protein
MRVAKGEHRPARYDRHWTDGDDKRLAMEWGSQPLGEVVDRALVGGST